VFDNLNRVQFGLGLLVVLVAASLLLLDAIESGVAPAVGLLGIILLATSGRRRGQSGMQGERISADPGRVGPASGRRSFLSGIR
jgi:hypothetical protein